MTQKLPQRFLALATIAGSLSLALSPIVASARQSGGPTTIGNLKRVSFAAIQYAADYDQGTVLTQQGDGGGDATWPVLLYPYLPDQTAYFDPNREVITTPTTKLSGIPVSWATVTTIGINDSGYSGKWLTTTKTCSGKRLIYQYGQRSLSTMDFPEKRIAFAPTAYANTGLGWFFFHSYDASWTKGGILANFFSWNNMVWNTRENFLYKNIPYIRADGSSGQLTAGSFKAFTEATSTLGQKQYCSWMDNTGKKTWGAAWSSE